MNENKREDSNKLNNNSKDLNDISSKLMKNIEDGLTSINVDIGDVDSYKEKKMDKEELEKRYQEATRNLKIDTSFIEKAYTDIQEKEHKRFEEETKLEEIMNQEHNKEKETAKDNEKDKTQEVKIKEKLQNENKIENENNIDVISIVDGTIEDKPSIDLDKTMEFSGFIKAGLQDEEDDDEEENENTVDRNEEESIVEENSNIDDNITVENEDIKENERIEEHNEDDVALVVDEKEDEEDEENIDYEDLEDEFDSDLEEELEKNLETELEDNLNEDINEDINEETKEKKPNPILVKLKYICDRIDAYYEKRRRKKTHNAAMSKVLVAVTCVFMSLILYIVYFVMIDSKDKLNNPYNERSILMEETVLRGSIYSSDEKILAETIEEDGEWKRYYPYGSLFAHVVGRYDKGKTGIELGNDYDLLSTNDTQIDKILNDINDEKSAGNSIVTTLDYGLQKIASEALAGRKGAVVAIEPSTGKILAMVSKPDYDPNYIAQDWEKYTNADNSKNTLLNRATQGLYPPGSTFKVVTALEYIREYDYEKYTYQCKGIQTFDGHNTRCYNTKVHGKEDFITSFANSCNTSFGNIGTLLNITRFNATCKGLLFNKDLPYDYTCKQSSFDLMEGSKTTLKVDTAIGQGKTVITPLHNALIACAVANNGVLMKPYVVDKIVAENMDVKDVTQPKKAAKLMSKNESSILKSMMKEVVDKGTAKSLKNNNYTAAGKTGSAEYDNSNKSHAWFIGFAPAEEPKIAVSIIVEEAGSGGTYAVPIARKLFDYYLN